ncbi:hypothetical protein GGX14DRAFT_413286, partial [Mycena pura]
MKIEWPSHFRSDGSRRKPPPSVMHGWLAKMRGTLLGNEELRSKGMAEMRDAQRNKRKISTHLRHKSVGQRNTHPPALFGTLSPKPRPVPVGRGSQYRQNSSQRIVGQPPRQHSSYRRQTPQRRQTHVATPRTP